MELSSKAKIVYHQIDTQTTKLGDLRKMAKELKVDHDLAMELWSTKEFLPRQLAILLMNNKILNQELIEKLDQDIQKHVFEERIHLIDWLIN